jgi:glycosyltransferase involved in cell wall biosynthesis
MKSFISEAYNISKENNIILPNYQSSYFLPSKSKSKISKFDGSKHLVYVGNLLFDDMKRVVELLESLVNNSIHIHLYPIGENIISSIKNMLGSNEHMHFHNPLPTKRMLEELQKYYFGLVPRPPDRHCLNNGFALPNKLFDYLAVGVPVIARNTKSITKFVQENKVGIIYKNIDELLKKLDDSSSNYTFDNRKFIMENHIYLIDNLYQKICGNIR